MSKSYYYYYTIVAALLALMAASEARYSPDISIHIRKDRRDAKVGAFPWQGSLQEPGGTRGDCGCVLVSDQWVVTAAHCVDARPFGLYVEMGLHTHDDVRVGRPVCYDIEYNISHPDWTGVKDSTDVAMIKLSHKVEINDFVKTIKMAEESNNQTNFDNQNCTISGWGITTEGGGERADTLQAADVRVRPLEACQDSFPKDNINEGHICIGGQGDAGPCKGDSGGPLVCEGKLAGVSSFGRRSCLATFPSVYTRIGFVRAWIRQVSGV